MSVGKETSPELTATDPLAMAAAVRYGVRHTAGVHRRLLLQILHGASDASIRFSDLGHLMRDLGIEERVRGSHHIFTREGIEEILNLQPSRFKLAEGLE